MKGFARVGQVVRKEDHRRGVAAGGWLQGRLKEEYNPIRKAAVMDENRFAELQYVEEKKDIQGALTNFIQGIQRHTERATKLCKNTKYWVYSSTENSFAPSKFVGFKNMTFDVYENAVKGYYTGAQFHGHKTKLAIEKILGLYKDKSLSSQLLDWGEEKFGRPIFDGVNTDKWRFLQL